jgi:uncharacterized protein YbbC (DUF1343 family)
VEIHITDRESFRPFLTGIQVISTVKRLYPDNFRWRKVKGGYWIDMLVGDDRVRRGIDEGGDPWSIVDELEGELIGYAYEKEKYHIY